MNGVDMLKGGLTNIKNNLPRVVIGRCLKCGTIRTIKNNDYTCHRCGAWMIDPDIEIRRRDENENSKEYRKKRFKKVSS